MNKALIILLYTLISSCSSLKTGIGHDKKKDPTNKISHDQVDLTIDEHHRNLEESPIDVVPIEETVRIGEHGGDLYANTESNAPSSSYNMKKLRIGLSLGPGLYRTINYVSFLKTLERNNFSPDIITGTGLGAIIAAMYAIGMTPEAIEWNFYKYFKEKKRNKPYDQDWINEIDEIFLDRFKNINVQDAKKKLFITLFDHNTNKTYYFDKGNLRDLLLLNLRLSNNFTESKSGQKYSTAFETEVFNARLLRQMGAEFTIAVDAIGSKINLENTDGFLSHLYRKVSRQIEKQKKDFDYEVSLPLNSMNLDSTKDSALFMQKTYDFMRKQSPVILKKMKAKIENLSHSGNEL